MHFRHSGEPQRSCITRWKFRKYHALIPDAWFLRAESLFNVATQLEDLDREPANAPRVIDSYGGRSLHEQSHGEAFMQLIENRFSQGLYFLDEPEAALSPQRQLEFLVLLDLIVKKRIAADHCDTLANHHELSERSNFCPLAMTESCRPNTKRPNTIASPNCFSIRLSGCSSTYSLAVMRTGQLSKTSLQKTRFEVLFALALAEGPAICFAQPNRLGTRCKQGPKVRPFVFPRVAIRQTAGPLALAIRPQPVGLGYANVCPYQSVQLRWRTGASDLYSCWGARKPKLTAEALIQAQVFPACPLRRRFRQNSG